MRKSVLYIVDRLRAICATYSDWKLLRWLLLTAFVIRALYGFVNFYKTGEAGFMDSWDYVFFAENILEQGLFPLKLHKWSQEVGPGYPLIIAASFLLFGKVYWPLILLNVIASTAVTVVIYFLAKTIYGKEVAVVSALWSVFYVQFFKFTPMILKESIVILLFALNLLVVIRIMLNKNKRFEIIWLILLFSLLIHIDERYFFYAPFFVIGLLFGNNGTLKKRFIAVVIFTAGICFSLIPWSYRNYVYYGRVVILTERTAKFTDKIFGYPPFKSKADLMSYSRANLPLYEAIADSIREGHKVRIKNVKFIPDIERAIREGIEVKTFSRTKHYWEEFKELWRPCKFSTSMIAYGYRYQPPWAVSSNIIFLLSYGLLLPFLVLEMVRGGVTGNKVIIFMTLLLVVHTVIHVFLAHARERYRIPIDPIILIMALHFIYALTCGWLYKKSFITLFRNK